MSYSINFVCRDSKKNKQGLSPVEMYIILNGKRTFIALPRKERPEVFRKAYNAKRNNEIKEFCATKLAETQGVMLKLGEKLTLETLKYALKYGVDDESNNGKLSKLLDDFLKIQADKTRTNGVTLKTYQKYEIVAKSFLEFIGDVPVETIGNADIKAYQIRVNQKYLLSTSHSHLCKLKTFFKYLIDNNFIKTNPFNNIKVPRGQQVVETITEDEFQRIVNKRFQIERLEKVRKLLVVAGGSGLAYCDVVNLSPSDFQNINGRIAIIKARRKTHIDYLSVLTDEAEAIVKELNYDISTLKLSNQKVNSYAKEIQDLCGITSVKSLHFHLFRHFYARRIINSGLPIELVSKCLGHSNIMMTQHYAKLFKEKTLNRITDYFILNNL